MFRNLGIALALLVTIVATGCSGGSSGGAVPPVAPATQTQFVAQTRQTTGWGGGDDQNMFAMAARIVKPIVSPVVNPTSAPTAAPTCLNCY